MLGVLWYLQRRFLRGARPPREIGVVARQSLGGKAQLVVVDVDGTRYVLGVTEQGISVIDRVRGPHPITSPLAEDGETEPVATEPPSHAAPLRRDRTRRPTDPLHGSLLSPATWRQTAEALRRAR